MIGIMISVTNTKKIAMVPLQMVNQISTDALPLGSRCTGNLVYHGLRMFNLLINKTSKEFIAIEF